MTCTWQRKTDNLPNPPDRVYVILCSLRECGRRACEVRGSRAVSAASLIMTTVLNGKAIIWNFSRALSKSRCNVILTSWPLTHIVSQRDDPHKSMFHSALCSAETFATSRLSTTATSHDHPFHRVRRPRCSELGAHVQRRCTAAQLVQRARSPGLPNRRLRTTGAATWCKRL